MKETAAATVLTLTTVSLVEDTSVTPHQLTHHLASTDAHIRAFSVNWLLTLCKLVMSPADRSNS